jgi:hypothetical protein
MGPLARKIGWFEPELCMLVHDYPTLVSRPTNGVSEKFVTASQGRGAMQPEEHETPSRQGLAGTRSRSVRAGSWLCMRAPWARQL